MWFSRTTSNRRSQKRKESVLSNWDNLHLPLPFVKQTPRDTEAPSAESIRTSFGNATFIPHFLLSRPKTEHEPFAKPSVVHASHLTLLLLMKWTPPFAVFKMEEKQGWMCSPYEQSFAMDEV